MYCEEKHEELAASSLIYILDSFYVVITYFIVFSTSVSRLSKHLKNLYIGLIPRLTVVIFF